MSPRSLFLCVLLYGAALGTGCPGDDGDDDVAGDDSAGDDDVSTDDDTTPTDDDTTTDDDSAVGDDDSTEDDDDSATASDDDDSVPQTVAECFDGVFANTPPIGPDYDQFGVVVGSHCQGTNHQQIDGIERVVFLGDSVTSGSPPTWHTDYYRNVLADTLATRFGLEPPGALWQAVNPFDGTTVVQDSGDFSCCSKWGARTDDLMQDNDMVLDCFPEDERSKRTLVILTIGGNDISSITQDGIEGVPYEEIWVDVEAYVQLLREAIEWFYEDPARFPGGVFVVFSNMFEYTDGTGCVDACPLAELAGFGAPWDDPDELAAMVIWANEQYASIAAETGTDMIFMLENFCGHGFYHDHPGAPCYRGPGTDCWFDLTCIHPNPAGHAAIAEMFEAVVDE